MDKNENRDEGMSEQSILASARRKFAAMAGAYALGTFNDNFYKQAVMLFAVAVGKEHFQGYAAMAFSVPFMLFAAPAGWLADRYPKRWVVIGAKALEVLAAMIGAAGVITGNIALMIAMVALMGLQSTFFSPALNGSIPELYPEDHVTKANGILRMLVTLGILLGIALSGFVLDLKGQDVWGASFGQFMLGLCVVGVALVGFLVSLFVPSRAAADPARPFPWSGPLETLRELGRMYKDFQLGRILIADVFIWAVGVFQIQVINPMGINQFGLGKGKTSLLVAAQLLGLAFGGLLAARLAKGLRWYRVLVPAGVAMAAFMGMISAVPLLPGHFQVGTLYLLIALAGAAGGLFLIPCESFLQIRPEPSRKGAVWAAANFASFGGMAIAGGLYIPLKNLTPTHAYGALGLACLAFSFYLSRQFRKF